MCYNYLGDFMNNFKYSNTNKRYHTLDYCYKNKYKNKIAKISLNLGLSCPNKDGTVGIGGCIYCSKSGSGEFAGDVKDSLKVQFEKGKKMILNKWPEAKFIAYFQANTNTYGDLKYLIKSYQEVLTYKDVVGINISTRDDSISEECFDYLEELNKKTDLVIELGLQSANNETLKLINRGTNTDNFIKCVKELNKRKIKVLVHIINGFPNEKKEDMLNTIRFLNKLDIWGIKIHMLQVLKNTNLEDIYKREKFKLLSQKEYVDIVISQLELINEKIVINRLTGDPKKEDLIEPSWVLNKTSVLNDIDKEFVKRNSYQGIRNN